MRPGTQQPQAINQVGHRFEAGRLPYFVNEWRKINYSNILDIVAHCHLDIGPLYTEEIEYVYNEEEQSIFIRKLSCYSSRLLRKLIHRKSKFFPPFFA